MSHCKQGKYIYKVIIRYCPL